MNLYENLTKKYDYYHASDNSVFTVTLSTFVKSKRFAESDAMRKMWEFHFMHRVQRCLPHKYKNRLDHDFIVEQSPDGNYHFHGLIALTPDAATRIYRDGSLTRQLKRDLDSFATTGEYRRIKINEYLIEPIREARLPSDWVRYILKTNDHICHQQQ